MSWSVEGVDAAGLYFNGPGPAASVNVRFFSNGSGELPGTLVGERLAQSYTGEDGNLNVDLAAPVGLETGTYWVSVQANLDFNPDGQWGWVTRSVQSTNGAAFRNVGDGFGTGCTTWTRNSGCGFDANAPDQVFRLRGSSGPPPPPPPPPPTSTAASAASATTTASTASSASTATQPLHRLHRHRHLHRHLHLRRHHRPRRHRCAAWCRG